MIELTVTDKFRSVAERKKFWLPLLIKDTFPPNSVDRILLFSKNHIRNPVTFRIDGKIVNYDLNNIEVSLPVNANVEYLANRDVGIVFFIRIYADSRNGS